MLTLRKIQQDSNPACQPENIGKQLPAELLWQRMAAASRPQASALVASRFARCNLQAVAPASITALHCKAVWLLDPRAP